MAFETDVEFVFRFHVVSTDIAAAKWGCLQSSPSANAKLTHSRVSASFGKKQDNRANGTPLKCDAHGCCVQRLVGPSLDFMVIQYHSTVLAISSDNRILDADLQR
jgi:hypothetical protein